MNKVRSGEHSQLSRQTSYHSSARVPGSWNTKQGFIGFSRAVSASLVSRRMPPPLRLREAIRSPRHLHPIILIQRRTVLVRAGSNLGAIAWLRTEGSSWRTS